MTFTHRQGNLSEQAKQISGGSQQWRGKSGSNQVAVNAPGRLKVGSVRTRKDSGADERGRENRRGRWDGVYASARKRKRKRKRGEGVQGKLAWSLE